jgi:hypothetical protein
VQGITLNKTGFYSCRLCWVSHVKCCVAEEHVVCGFMLFRGFLKRMIHVLEIKNILVVYTEDCRV